MNDEPPPLIRRLRSAIAHMAPHQRERQNGILLIEALEEIECLTKKFTKLDKPKFSGDPMMDSVLATPNPDFRAWVDSLPPSYWARYDLSAARIGWEAACKFTKNPACAPQLSGACPAPSAAGSGFFIVNTTDRPSEEYLAERRADGKFYYIHPQLRDVKLHWGMSPLSPTPVEDFGMLVDVKAGILIGVRDESAEVTAKYSDGRSRRWQGSRMFSFRCHNEKSPSTAATGNDHE